MTVRLRAAALAAGIAVVISGCGSSGSAHRGASSPASSVAGGGAPPSTAPAAPTQLVAEDEPWTLPLGVSRPVVVADGTGFVILGGLSPGDVSTSRIVTVDPAAGQAQLAGHLALAVHDSAGAALGGRMLVFGGGSYSTVSAVQAWTSGIATEVGRLPTPRSDLSAAVSGGTAYVVGGFDGSAMTHDVLATTDGTSFRVVGTLAVGVRYAAVAIAGGALWVIGGVTSTTESGPATLTDAIQRVDLATGQVTVSGHLPQPMGHAAAMVLGGSVFVMGGRVDGAASADIWRLLPDGSAVQPAGHLPGPRSDAGSAVLGSTGYLVGGEVSGPAAPLSSVVVLHP